MWYIQPSMTENSIFWFSWLTSKYLHLHWFSSIHNFFTCSWLSKVYIFHTNFSKIWICLVIYDVNGQFECDTRCETAFFKSYGWGWIGIKGFLGCKDHLVGEIKEVEWVWAQEHIPSTWICDILGPDHNLIHTPCIKSPKILICCIYNLNVYLYQFVYSEFPNIWFGMWNL